MNSTDIQPQLRGAVEKIRVVLEITTAVHVLEGSDKDEVERLLMEILETMHDLTSLGHRGVALIDNSGD